MNRLAKLERDIEALDPTELSSFREWFSKFDAEHWDEQIRADVDAARLDRLGSVARAAHRAGRTRRL